MSYDLILKGGNVIDVVARRTYKGNVLIKDGRIVGIEPPNTRYDKNSRKVVDVSKKYIAPGLIDAHLHIESSMLSPVEFSKKAVEHGTTSIFVDPHEVANVLGRKGIELFLKQAEAVPLDMYIGIPSCVPATHLENSGASINLEDIKELILHPRVYGLAEMMNAHGIIHNLGDAREKVDFVYDYGKIVDGHAPGLTGKDLLTYVTNGRDDGKVRIMSDHECSSAQEALEKHKAGMYIALRYGSASKDLDNILPKLIKTNSRLDRFMLCSDDLDARELYENGHVDRSVKRAREIVQSNSDLGLEEATMLALSLATQQPANYFSRFLKLNWHPLIGDVRINKKANLVVFSSLEELLIDKVVHNGKLVVDNGRYLGKEVRFDYSGFLKSMNTGRKISEHDFRIRYAGKKKSLEARVIGAKQGSLLTDSLSLPFKVYRGLIKANPEQDIAKIGVFERHNATGSYTVGFVKGLGIKRGAVGSTVAHDSHNMIIAGADDKSMAMAAQFLINQEGGMIVVTDSNIDYFPLSIGGLMSTEPIERVVKEHKNLVKAVKRTGSDLDNIFMSLSFLALPVIPELKITDKGLVDVNKFDFVRLY